MQKMEVPVGAEHNKQLIQRFLTQVMQEGNVEVVPEYIAEDFVDRTAMPGQPFEGHASVEAYVRAQDSLLSDRRIEIVHVVADDEFVCVLTKTTGRHTGDALGIPPSGETLQITFLHMLRVRDGKFVEHWGFGDLIQQLSAVSQ